MEMLTRVLSRHVYAVDLHDLPLDKLCEHRVRRLRASRPATHGAGTSYVNISCLKATITTNILNVSIKQSYRKSLSN